MTKIHDVCNQEMLALPSIHNISSSEYYCDHCHKSLPMPRHIAEELNRLRELRAKLEAQQMGMVSQ